MRLHVYVTVRWRTAYSEVGTSRVARMRGGGPTGSDVGRVMYLSLDWCVLLALDVERAELRGKFLYYERACWGRRQYGAKVAPRL